jgi:hypothetical protein
MVDRDRRMRMVVDRDRRMRMVVDRDRRIRMSANRDRLQRWALSPISVISDIGLSLISELPISD